jgi:hypothetical protein
MPELFNPAKKIEVDNKVSGVLVVAQKAASGAALADEEKLYSKAPLAVEFEDGDDDDIG